MVDEALLEKVKSLISERERIDRELAEIFGGATPTRRGRPRKEAAPSTNGTSIPDNAI